MELHNITKTTGYKKPAKRVGRGFGSKKGGHTSGRGMKGQNSRKGRHAPFGFEGGQVPFYKKLPQIGGFKNHNSKKIITVYLGELNSLFANGATVSPKSLVESGYVKEIPRHGVKILANGKIEKKLKLAGFRMSESAKTALEKAGCEIL